MTQLSSKNLLLESHLSITCECTNFGRSNTLTFATAENTLLGAIASAYTAMEKAGREFKPPSRALPPVGDQVLEETDSRRADVLT